MFCVMYVQIYGSVAVGKERDILGTDCALSRDMRALATSFFLAYRVEEDLRDNVWHDMLRSRRSTYWDRRPIDALGEDYVQLPIRGSQL